MVTSNDRYRDMVGSHGEVARTGGTCGMQVHTAADGDDEGVAVIDRIAPWLPVLLALSANSPFVEARDSGMLYFDARLSEALRVAHWRAPRYGMADSLVHPETGRLAPARDVVDALVARVRVALEETGDLGRVEDALARSVTGNGATRQRAAFERGGEATVVDDLVARTEASWQSPDLP